MEKKQGTLANNNGKVVESMSQGKVKISLS